MKRDKKVSKILFIEGTSGQSSGSLVQGFASLFSQVLPGAMPRIVMGDSKFTTIRKFKNNQRSEFSFLLVDLDDGHASIPQKIKEYDLEAQEEYVYFMVQELEAWFISQPAIIDSFFGSGTANHLPSPSQASQITKPAKVLQQATRNSSKGRYHKVKHCIELLKRLDAVQLRVDFPQFNGLVDKIAST